MQLYANVRFGRAFGAWLRRSHRTFETMFPPPEFKLCLNWLSHFCGALQRDAPLCRSVAQPQLRQMTTHRYCHGRKLTNSKDSPDNILLDRPVSSKITCV